MVFFFAKTGGPLLYTDYGMCIKPEYFPENNLNLGPIQAIEKQIKNGHLKVFVWLLTQLWWFCFNWGLGNFKMKLLLQRVEKMLDFEAKF